MMSEVRKRNSEIIKEVCLYHLPGIPKITSNCEKCLEDYDEKHFPNNYDCPNFFPFPQVSYEEVIGELEKRKIKITPRIEKLVRKEIGLVDTILASKRKKVSPKKFVEDFLEEKYKKLS